MVVFRDEVYLNVTFTKMVNLFKQIKCTNAEIYIFKMGDITYANYNEMPPVHVSDVESIAHFTPVTLFHINRLAVGKINRVPQHPLQCSTALG